MSEIGFFKKIAFIFAAWLATRNRIPQTYALDNSAGCKWNFCSLYLRFVDDPCFESFLVCERPSWKGLSGLGFSKVKDYPIGFDLSEPQSPSKGVSWIEGNMSLPFETIGNFNVEFNRIYGTKSIAYSSVWRYLWGELFHLHFWMDCTEVISRWWFKYRFDFTPERMNILIEIVEWKRRDLKSQRVRSLGSEFSHIELFTVIATWRAWSLSDHSRHLAELKFILDSLVSTGELSHEPNGRYTLNAKSLATISAYETDNRKQHRSERNNKLTLFLTFVLALAAILELFLK
ncbi:hypothetical protein [Pseudotabrizicola algicola]|uniref:Uncharacterized protein n=1 Tax=Pseudotabrizicola algicola TaxID=2709381 RepID=A0A6B3RZB5_9RHOB|nr:hypothetical protein [Pseudotabrizicola algicola]NEX48499.1 hypothetical protein [Pseudotabrizicola algicola]